MGVIVSPFIPPFALGYLVARAGFVYHSTNAIVFTLNAGGFLGSERRMASALVTAAPFCSSPSFMDAKRTFLPFHIILY